MASKRVKVYPYRVTVKNIEVDFFKFPEIFHRDRINDNIAVLYENDIPFLLIIDDIKSNFLRGKFMHLRKDIPPILNLETCRDEFLSLPQNKFLQEISHFSGI